MSTTDRSGECGTANRPTFSFAAVSAAKWYVAVEICALADSERHLGHAVREGSEWLAYDAIHPNAANDGFRFLGSFRTDVDARLAIESSVGVCGRWWAEEQPQARPF
jgi:hypothetical protein